MKKNHPLLLALIVCFAFTAHGDGLVCHHCGDDIDGRYFEYKSPEMFLRVCQPCNRTLPRCNACRVPYKGTQLTRHKGEALCSSCLDSALYCSMCDTRIQGRYIQLRDQDGNVENFCQHCHTHASKCAVCQRPSRLAEIDLASGACVRCIPKLPDCTSCGRKIVGTYFEYQFSDGQFCSNCKNTKPECYSCGVPVGHTYWRFPDGRSICETCNETAITDAATIRGIMSEVERLIRVHLGLELQQKYTLRIETLNNTSLNSQQARQSSSGHSPLFGRELGLYRYTNGRSEIFLLYGLPREMLYETAAHEWAHAWQMENAPRDQSLELKEGFAQWVAAQILRIKGFDDALKKLEARNDYPYGVGYKRFKAVETNLGRDDVIGYAKNAVR